jgi:hypothetical protein
MRLQIASNTPLLAAFASKELDLFGAFVESG